jgi:hypothetical protein
LELSLQKLNKIIQLCLLYIFILNKWETLV